LSRIAAEALNRLLNKCKPAPLPKDPSVVIARQAASEQKRSAKRSGEANGTDDDPGCNRNHHRCHAALPILCHLAFSTIVIDLSFMRCPGVPSSKASAAPRGDLQVCLD